MPCTASSGFFFQQNLMLVLVPKTNSILCLKLILETDAIRIFVLDEADEMLSRGFKDQIYDIFRKMPANVQVLWELQSCSTVPL